MERLRGPISPLFPSENECLEQENAFNITFGEFLTTESTRFGQPFFNPSFEDKMPVLQMLGIEPPSLSSSPEPNFQLLLRLQQLKRPKPFTHFSELESRIPSLELESCVTHVSESHSPVKSETKDYQYPHSSSCPEFATSPCNLEPPNSPENYKPIQICNRTNPQFGKLNPVREKRKRKRTRTSKNMEEVESQRMTHIAVERNRRKQMNDHLTALRSLMPSSFIQRGDQASIVGGAIDFVKELEQLLQSLQAQNQMRKSEEEGYSPDSATPFSGFFMSSPPSQQSHFKYIANGRLDGGVCESTAENKSTVANIEVTVIQTHANLKILSPRKPGQLLKAIAALEDLYLTILHLNVTSLEHSVLYSFSLKIEEECRLGSADEIATAVYQIFSFVD